MSRIEGKILTCDRCGKQVILTRKKEDKVLDGGYTRTPEYEDEPNGWEFIMRGGIGDLCPECNELWKNIVQKFLSGAGYEQGENSGL